MNKIAAAVAAAAFALGIGFTSQSVEAMPNPIVEYQTYTDAANNAGFKPLVLPQISGWSCNYISVISGKVADLGFKSSYDNDAVLRVRTARADSPYGKDISGVYGVKWQNQVINGTTVSIASINGGAAGWVAHWQHGSYVFSAQAAGLNQQQFMQVLTYGLVDITAHYY